MIDWNTLAFRTLMLILWPLLIIGLGLILKAALLLFLWGWSLL